eukprot:4031634-Amphidinium_carterae.1
MVWTHVSNGFGKCHYMDCHYRHNMEVDLATSFCAFFRASSIGRGVCAGLGVVNSHKENDRRP